MIVEHLTRPTTCGHEADETHTYEQLDVFGAYQTREAGLCRLCGVWFDLPRDPDAFGLFDNYEETMT